MDWITSVKEIKKAQENNQLVIFVGAGVSKNSQVPSWWELIKEFAKSIGYDKCEGCKDRCDECPNEECEERYRFSQDEFLRIPEYHYQKNKDEDVEKYHELIQNTLRGGTGPNLIDDEIFNLLPHHIITTNYDSLLESSAAANTQLYTVVSQDSDLLSKASERYLIKMHGDLEYPETIVLKESDYIDYEQNHPLISTFIRSLLVNHTFLFLGYSLNDYNLNLIIGWINYFSKFYGITERPSNFLIDCKAASEFEEMRLRDKNIHVVSLGELPEDIEIRTNIPSTFTAPIGRKLLAYLRCITSEKILKQYIPLEECLCEKYESLRAYKKISFQDLLEVYPLGRTKFLDTELIFYGREWYEGISELLEKKDSLIIDVFKRAGISAIQLWGEDMRKQIPGIEEAYDGLLRCYLDNDYLELAKELDSCLDLTQKLYYKNLLGATKQEIEKILEIIASEKRPKDYIEVVLEKTRARIATISIIERQEERTHELQKLFDTATPKYHKAMNFLQMLFDSASPNMYVMQKFLNEHEKRYEYNSRTVHFDHAHMNLWGIKSYAYDYYFFMIKNGIPLHYFSEPKEYFSYYLKAVLCTYAPVKKSKDVLLIGTLDSQPHYILGEVELDIFVKYSNSKNLKKWLEEYSVQELEIETDVNVVRKFENLCASVSCFKVRYWIEQVYCFIIIICLVNLENKEKYDVWRALLLLIEDAARSTPSLIIELFDVIEYVVVHLPLEKLSEEYTRLLDVLLDEKVYSIITERYASKLRFVVKRLSDSISVEKKAYFIESINVIEDEKEKCSRAFNIRFILGREYCTLFFREHEKELTISQIFDLLIEGILEYRDSTWRQFIDEIKKLDEERKLQIGMRSYPDWLMIYIERCIILKLMGFRVDVSMLEPYAHYSEHLQFMLQPETFDYSIVDTSHYMWQNFMYSKEYQHFFIEHKKEIVTERLKRIFDAGVDTSAQRKIVYGILLDADELQEF